MQMTEPSPFVGIADTSAAVHRSCLLRVLPVLPALAAAPKNSFGTVPDTAVGIALGIAHQTPSDTARAIDPHTDAVIPAASGAYRPRGNFSDSVFAAHPVACLVRLRAGAPCQTVDVLHLLAVRPVP